MTHAAEVYCRVVHHGEVALEVRVSREAIEDDLGARSLTDRMAEDWMEKNVARLLRTVQAKCGANEPLGGTFLVRSGDLAT